jgi:hypothetical protein
MGRVWRWAVILLALVGGRAAQAAPLAVDGSPPLGVALLAGGGVQDFTGGSASKLTTVGGYWCARLVMGTRQLLGAEASYVGSVQNIRGAVAIASDSVLLSNGAEAAVRFNGPIFVRSALLEPFIFAGAGWTRFHVASRLNPFGFSSGDDVITFPYGGGLAYAWQDFIADARFTYRRVFSNDLLGPGSGRLDNWSLGAQIGFEF